MREPIRKREKKSEELNLLMNALSEFREDGLNRVVTAPAIEDVQLGGLDLGETMSFHNAMFAIKSTFPVWLLTQGRLMRETKETVGGRSGYDSSQITCKL